MERARRRAALRRATSSSPRCIETGCAAARTGWRPQFLLLRRAGALAGRDAAVRQVALLRRVRVRLGLGRRLPAPRPRATTRSCCARCPSRRCAGRRLLARDDAERARARRRRARARASGVSSLHVLFPHDDEARAAARAQACCCGARVQFHWRNEGYADFDEFLARLSHARRKNIRQERRRVREAGVTLALAAKARRSAREHWEFFHRCYRHTYAAHGSSPYLSLEFFLRIGAALPQQRRAWCWPSATVGRSPRRSSCSTRETLYGRYWGALEHVPLLHFECCYYQAIEYAIARGLQVFEGGAQGEHKIFRGLMPVETLSAHWLARPALRPRDRGLPRARGRRASRATSTSCANIARSSRRRNETERKDGDRHRRGLGLRRRHRAPLRRRRAPRSSSTTSTRRAASASRARSAGSSCSAT